MSKINQSLHETECSVSVSHSRLFAEEAIELERISQPYLKKNKKLIVDLAGVRFIDLSGIRVLLDLMSRHVELINCPRYILKKVTALKV